MTKTSSIVLLNGVGSAGKSSIAKALQEITADPFLHVQMDSFLDMLPPAYQNHPNGFAFQPVVGAEEPEVAITTGPVGARLMQGMRQAIAALADAGNNLIIDDVLLNADWQKYAELLAPFSVFRVGVLAPLDVLEARERARGDRLIGLARWQYPRVHAGIDYDLEIDTSTVTPIKAANLIKDRFGL